MKYKSGDKFSFMLCSDVHFDNPKCNRKLFFSHLEKAKQLNAGILCFGDFYDVMGGNYDPRRNKKGIRPEYNVANYLDAVVNDSVEQLSPYSQNWVLMSQGNHETSILNKLETGLTQRFVSGLKEKHGSNVHKGLYQGFVRFVFEQEAGNGGIRSSTLFFHHGAWGGVITKGTLSVSRFASIAPDADIIVSGHTHDKWLVPHERFRLKQNGEVITAPQYHIRTATYKEEFAEGSGWATEKIVIPKPQGCIFMHFQISGSKSELGVNFEMVR